MELAWVPEVGDLADAYAVHNRRKKATLKIALVLGACALAALVGLVTSSPVLFGAGVGGLAGGSLMPILQPRAVRRVWRQNLALRRPVQVRVTAERGIESRTSVGSAVTGWSSLEGFDETDRVFVLRQAGVRLSLFVLAKRGADSREQIDVLRDLLSAHIGHAPA
jgi:hypothetical protein